MDSPRAWTWALCRVDSDSAIMCAGMWSSSFKCARGSDPPPPGTTKSSSSMRNSSVSSTSASDGTDPRAEERAWDARSGGQGDPVEHVRVVEATGARVRSGAC
jgi:hypothetical protein